MSRFPRLALLAAPGEPARDAEKLLRERHEFVGLDEADAVIALGGAPFTRGSADASGLWNEPWHNWLFDE
jgi:hypothetical protein